MRERLQQAKRGARAAYSSLSIRNYRLYFWGQAVSMAGTWMQTVAQSFLVLRLTNSGTDLGIATAARYLPILILGPFGGLVVDRMNKRRLLYVTQVLSGLLAGVFAVLIETHTIRMWMVYLLALALGVINTFDNPGRQSFTPEMVPPSELANAVTLNSVTVNMARIIGAALGGLLVATIGLTLCFALNGLSFAAVFISLLMMRQSELYPTKAVEKAKGQVREGLAYVLRTPALLVPLIMIAVVGMLTWEFPVTLPLMAKYTFHGGAGTYGVMMSVMSVGAVVGGSISAAAKRVRARSLSVAALGWGIAITAAAFAPSFPLELVALLFVGYGSVTFNARAKTALQLAAEPTMRGRVMGVWALAWQGSTPIGGPICGFVAQYFNPRIALLLGAAAALGSALFAWSSLSRVDLRADEAEAAAALPGQTLGGVPAATS